MVENPLKYRLIKKFPLSPEVGTIADFTNADTITNFTSLPSIKQEDCQDSEYWSPYVLTTDDGVDVYINENKRYFEPPLYGILKNNTYSNKRPHNVSMYDKFVNTDYFLKYYNNDEFQYLVANEKLAKQKEEELRLLEKTGQSKFKVNEIVKVISFNKIGTIKYFHEEGVRVALVDSELLESSWVTTSVSDLTHSTQQEQIEYYSTQFNKGDIVQWFKLGEFIVEELIYNEELQSVCIKGLYKNEDCSSIDPIEAPIKECLKRFDKEEKEIADELKEEVKSLVNRIKHKYNIDINKIPKLMGTIVDVIKFVSTDSHKVKGECEVSFDDGPTSL